MNYEVSSVTSNDTGALAQLLKENIYCKSFLKAPYSKLLSNDKSMFACNITKHSQSLMAGE